MTDEEILKKAIEKAQKNGWETIYHPDSVNDLIHYIDQEIPITSRDYFHVIFNHYFAKAFWKNENYRCNSCRYWLFEHEESAKDHFEFIKLLDAWGTNYCKTTKQLAKLYLGWQVHLQQMVLEEDPIRYLEKFL